MRPDHTVSSLLTRAAGKPLPGQTAFGKREHTPNTPSRIPGQTILTGLLDDTITPTTLFQHDAALLLEGLDVQPGESPDLSPLPDSPRRTGFFRRSPSPIAEPTALISSSPASLSFWERIQFSIPRKPIKRALLVGLKYNDELTGSHSDVEAMRRFLIARCGFLGTNITTLLDDRGPGVKYPTAEDIWTALKELVRDARPGDVLFFLFCGHGYRVLNRNNAEPDGFDEVILGLNYATGEKINPWTGERVDVATRDYILDDDLLDLILKLPPKCLFVALFDTCHSGTALDLPKERTIPWSDVSPPTASRPPTNLTCPPHSTTGSVLVNESTQPLQRTPTILPTSSFSEESQNMASTLHGPVMQGSQKRRSTVEPRVQRPRKTRIDEQSKNKHATLISLSACADHQETFEDHEGNGVLVKAFIDSLGKAPRPKYMDLLRDLTVASHAANKHRDKAEWPHPRVGSLFEIGPDERFEFCAQARCLTLPSLIAIGLSSLSTIYPLLPRSRFKFI